ncbi:adp-ribose glycohydrolase macrod2 [Anaeramoeba flamelloides]|uniref:Adp-ribose glycohydrolase macrod2 n=1 Tax=Anaeramoeba flamelloides TaxID=1746091 RepID=A0ABQ8X7K5_9EUKA|nr:adp-ribose glycohydrolase macrod2 [Anaeramoeba flamelloides]
MSGNKKLKKKARKHHKIKLKKKFGIIPYDPKISEEVKSIVFKKTTKLQSQEKRRKKYHCGEDFTSVEDIDTWETFILKNIGDDEVLISHDQFPIDSALNKKVALWHGNMVKLEIDAVVNAARSSLLGGGGIDGAIHEAAGQKLREECSRLNCCNHGDTKITTGHLLPAKYILHSVGPIGENKKLLTKCYQSLLNLLIKCKLKTVGLCGISSGLYGYPLEKAVHVALHTTRKWLEKKKNADKVDKIVFVTYLTKEWDVYKRLMPIYFPFDPKKVKKIPKTSEKLKNTKENENENEKEKKENENENEKEKKEMRKKKKKKKEKKKEKEKDKDKKKKKEKKKEKEIENENEKEIEKEKKIKEQEEVEEKEKYTKKKEKKTKQNNKEKRKEKKKDRDMDKKEKENKKEEGKKKEIKKNEREINKEKRKENKKKTNIKETKKEEEKEKHTKKKEKEKKQNNKEKRKEKKKETDTDTKKKKKKERRNEKRK